MGSGSSKSTQKTSGPKLQNRTFHSCFEYSLRAEKFANTDKEYEDFISTLTGNTMSSDFKLGKKKKDLISKVVYFNKTYTIGIILEITHQVKYMIFKEIL